jgi:hypothetical protein
VFHGEKYTTVTTEKYANDRAGADKMDEMVKAIQLEFYLDT